jgi:5-methylcytosine-specific restriction protein A
VAWQGSDRRRRLPGDWEARRRAVLARCGGRCEHRFPNGGRCPRPATDVDHIEHGDDHSLANLQGLCADHHKRKSSREGNATQAARRGLAKRPPEEHPGKRGQR